MPIRFACPHCRQKLTVSTRKAGSQADCPRCKRELTIPEPPLQSPKPVLAAAKASIATSAAPSEGAASEPSPPPVAANERDAAEPPAPPPAEQSDADQPHIVEQPSLAAVEGEATYFTPDEGGFEGLELIYDMTGDREEPAAQPAGSDLVAVPRYVIYLQGGLLAVVALVAFAIGLLVGGTMNAPAENVAGPQTAVLRGNVQYAAASRQLPDEGAVTIAIPLDAERPDEKAPITGLRPADPVPGEAHRGVSILRDLGGGYARADAAGQVTIELPDRGRYLVLVISREKRLRAADEISTADILKLGPYFDNAADLLADRRYQLTTETIRGERRMEVTFE